MPTVLVNLSTDEYVKINGAFNPLILQAHRDSVRVVISSVKPVKSNAVFHLISGSDPILHIDSVDTDVWALAITTNSSLIVSETGLPTVRTTGIYNNVINELFTFHTGVSSTVAVDSVAGATSLELADATGFVVGDTVHIHNGNTETTFPTMTAPPSGNVITLDRPLDHAYSIGDDVEIVHTNLSDDIGSLASPVSHIIQPLVNDIWHIERLILSMTHVNAATDDKFGGIAALNNGVVLRANVNGQFGTFTNWKTNEDIRLDMYDVVYTDKAGPSLFGTAGRGSFNRVGVTVRLDGNIGDYLEILIQDDLTALGSFYINGQGHIGK